MKGRALLAVLFSLWQPGLGQLYAGRPRRALAFALVVFALAFAFITGLVGRSFTVGMAWVLLGVIAQVASAVDAGRLAWRQSANRPWYGRWYVCAPLGLVVVVAGWFCLESVQVQKTYHLPSASMEPTLERGDHVVAAFDVFESAPPARGDIVLFVSPEDSRSELMKRVVALGGDVIEVRDKKIYLNGYEIEEPWAVHADPSTLVRDDSPNRYFQRDQLGPVTVPEGHLFVLGDNRDFSRDSRFYGPVSIDSVRGAPLYVYWARNRARIGTRLAPGAATAP